MQALRRRARRLVERTGDDQVVDEMLRRRFTDALIALVRIRRRIGEGQAFIDFDQRNRHPVLARRDPRANFLVQAVHFAGRPDRYLNLLDEFAVDPETDAARVGANRLEAAHRRHQVVLRIHREAMRHVKRVGQAQALSS
ncbi:MAG: hypothetical protein ABIZ49_00370 [Opitutaceae bacterium]